jgi:hypothetical protein
MANLAAFPTAKYFPKSGELLVFGNFPVNQLAEIYGTPMFAYDRAVLDLKNDAFRSALPEPFAMYYCIKANPSLAVPIARKRSRSIGALGILAGIRNPGGSGPKHFQLRKNFGNPLLSEKHQDACSRKHLRSHLSR